LVLFWAKSFGLLFSGGCSFLFISTEFVICWDASQFMISFNSIVCHKNEWNSWKEGTLVDRTVGFMFSKKPDIDKLNIHIM